MFEDGKRYPMEDLQIIQCKMIASDSEAPVPGDEKGEVRFISHSPTGTFLLVASTLDVETQEKCPSCGGLFTNGLLVVGSGFAFVTIACFDCKIAKVMAQKDTTDFPEEIKAWKEIDWVPMKKAMLKDFN